MFYGIKTYFPMLVKHEPIVSPLNVFYMTPVQVIELLSNFYLKFHVDVAKGK
jgi:hypothetical protein